MCIFDNKIFLNQLFGQQIQENEVYKVRQKLFNILIGQGNGERTCLIRKV